MPSSLQSMVVCAEFMPNCSHDEIARRDLAIPNSRRHVQEASSGRAAFITMAYQTLRIVHAWQQ
jgi:hypothetical protein